MQSSDVASYLRDHPDFFEQHPELLSAINLPHPQSGQAISLIERQSMLLRDRIRALEARQADLLNHGRENDAIADKLVQWARGLLLEPDATRLPGVVTSVLQRLFDVPGVALRVWKIRPEFAHLPCARPVGDDVPRLAASMAAPFCGSNVGFEAAQWMQEEAGAPLVIQSLAMMPLRIGASPEAFGMLALGSPDKDRFQITMGTAFLARIAELASAALARLSRP